MNWREGLRPGIACLFSDARADENLILLQAKLGREWIERSISRAGFEQHPILREWATSDLASFLSMNTLAEDLRAIGEVTGLDTALQDLRSARRADPTRHVLHSAAMFARGGGTVERFFPQTSDRLPDYLLRMNGSRLAVEAKFVEKTDVEKAFDQYAQALTSRLSHTALTLDRVHPTTYIVIKDPHSLPHAEEVSEVVRETLDSFRGAPLERRLAAFNVFMYPAQFGFDVYQSIHILCPRSERENLRIQSRSKDASKQLRSEFTEHFPGVLHLQLTRHQDPHVLRNLLTSRFERNQLSGIGGVLLSMTAMNVTPPLATPVDALANIRNTATTRPVPAEIRLGTVGGRISLFDVVPATTSVSAYSYQSSTAKPAQPVATPLSLTVPLITQLVPDAFS